MNLGLQRFSAVLATSVAIAAPANAHVWTIGWESSGGNLTFYGLSYHGGSLGGTGSVDDFAANPAGFVVNGTNFTFDIGSAVDLNDCVGAGGLTSGTCSPTWNTLDLDGAVHSRRYTSQRYGKYASRTLDGSDLSSINIGSGSNSVTLGSFSRNAHWADLRFDSATVPIDIEVSTVPLPATLPLIGSLLGGLGFAGWRRRRG